MASVKSETPEPTTSDHEPATSELKEEYEYYSESESEYSEAEEDQENDSPPIQIVYLPNSTKAKMLKKKEPQATFKSVNGNKTPSSAPRKKSSHPTTPVMVKTAIAALGETRKGSSVQSIKKYIEKNYDVDMHVMSRYINKYFRTGVENEELIQTKGIGATGSFKLGKNADNKMPKKVMVKIKTPSKSKASSAKKSKPETPTKAKKVASTDKKKKKTPAKAQKKATAPKKK